MSDTKHHPVAHDHKAFLRKATKRRGFQAAYEALAVEYAVANEMLAARRPQREQAEKQSQK